MSKYTNKELREMATIVLDGYETKDSNAMLCITMTAAMTGLSRNAVLKKLQSLKEK